METKSSVTSVHINKYGQVLLTSDNLQDLLLQKKPYYKEGNISIIKDDEFKKFEQYQPLLLEKTISFLDEPEDAVSVEKFHDTNSDIWYIPEKYMQLDIKAYLINKCLTKDEEDRVQLEYALFEAKGMTILLKLLTYLVDYMRQNNMVWGVGRGSSVASYCLFLIGIHRVDSIQYGLDIHEFLHKDKEIT